MVKTLAADVFKAIKVVFMLESGQISKTKALHIMRENDHI